MKHFSWIGWLAAWALGLSPVGRLGAAEVSGTLSADTTWSRGAEYMLLLDPGNPGDEQGKGKRPTRAELFVDHAMNYSLWSREMVGGRMEPRTAPFRPVANDEGHYIPLLIETNRERVSRSGEVFPAQHLDWGRLQYGREPARSSALPGAEASYAYDPHCEWFVNDLRRTIEVAIPWGLLNVGDPSSRSVLDDKDGTREIEVTRTAGIGLLAWATKIPAFRVDSLGPEDAQFEGTIPAAAVQFMGAPGTTQAAVSQEVQVTSPAAGSYVWKEWELPIVSERVKRSAMFVRDAFEGMDARDQRSSTDLDAKSR